MKKSSKERNEGIFNDIKIIFIKISTIHRHF